jgi:lysophospholipase L1-like esterase
MLSRLLRRSAALLMAVAIPAAAGPIGEAPASPGSRYTAIVSMGDSYISGEAGRWQGNSVNPAGDRDGTDRACAPLVPQLACTYDPAKVYIGGSDSGCHRSDVAEIRSARVPVDEKLNISCSGGRTKNIFRASSGGEGQNGEAPQADQLAQLARDRDVKLIVLSLGGNDLGFASIVTACFLAYETRQGPCREEQQAQIDAQIPRAVADVERAIDEIRAVMAGAGYGVSDYRLVMQTYPSVMPRAAEARYAENDPRRTSDGCPFYDADLDWARDSAAPQIGAVSKAAARSRGVEVLELVDALQGREVCARTAEPATPTTPPSAERSEWGRALSVDTIAQGEVQEVFHPNAYAQQAIGSCLSALYREDPGSFACTNTPGAGPQGMVLTRTGAAPTPVVVPARAVPGGQGSANGGAGCSSTSPLDRVTIRPRGRGLRFVLPGALDRVRVDVFQHSRGRRVFGNRLVARLTSRRSFAWRGTATRRGRGVRDGMFMVRLRGAGSVRRIAVRRVGGRFGLRPDFAARERCGLLRLVKTERPVFGGRTNRALRIAYRVGKAATVRVTVRQGARIIRRFQARRVGAGQLVRLRVAAEGVARGDVRVVVQASAGVDAAQQVLTVRRV